MPTFDTPGPIAATVVVGISDGTAARVDATSKRGSVRNSVPPQENPDTSDNQLTVHARTRYGDIIVHGASVSVAS
jgi:hypothetical protein